MKNVKHMLSIAFISMTALTATPAIAATVGSPAPDFTLQNVDGESISLSDFKGKNVVLEWANYQCPFVEMHYEAGNIPGLQTKYTAEDVVWLTIHSSAPGEQGHHELPALKEESTRVNNAATHVLADPEGIAGKLYDAKTTPHMYVIDTNGILQYNGGIDSTASSDASSLATTTPYAANAVDAVLAGQTPDPSVTQPYGCNVKYAK